MKYAKEVSMVILIILIIVLLTLIGFKSSIINAGTEAVLSETISDEVSRRIYE